MEKKVALSNQEKKNRQLRVPYDKDLTLRMENGVLISGRAKNISSSGFLMVVGGYELNQAMKGMSATLIVELDIETLEIRCQVIRMEKNSMAVEFT